MENRPFSLPKHRLVSIGELVVQYFAIDPFSIEEEAFTHEQLENNREVRS